MAPIDRSAQRVVFIWSARPNNATEVIGGLQHIGGTTNGDFLQMIQILLPNASHDLTVQGPSGSTLTDDDQPLLRGDYVVSGDDVKVSEEVVLPRALSQSSGTRVRGFRDAVRARDGRCVITKRPNVYSEFDEWTRFEVAHLFPVAYEQQWITDNYSRYISQVPSTGGTINSVQNGLLLRTDLHDGFDQYRFSINPRANHKVIVFSSTFDDLVGQSLDRQLLDDPSCPPDELLWWHFTQAVLANVRGAGEPIYEHDFPPGSDMMGEIMEGPNAPQRLEFELFSRLAAHVEVVDTASTAKNEDHTASEDGKQRE
ncbi:hypothetical protein SPBR_09128 [Sporothrix brasiliensis 5110]|uniref:Uncharacterized protein n=1 Tax=Sporothrix brasiliensis 5110 TaxID=1398154 RepID=A0A0C2J187_9PEZI|nr:uncharacterized protein SPBR_09128 [Sporothrix brasiliensis 5110]KIH92775.1 hypothetical protein SPBR_09128 [Sporothrix brasiliensis 5110]